ncbi:hypothetical protein KORDIASMS9_00718 [Kordia sp. SMS9]|uniref:hypothetical protein n=1 Tax=Kordia sp. SMS9 TaxID=2282170 RepID=UPI000E0D0F3B|nr:hypothetical protein [Kordia sp. SMS9]AXG68503.1 hypothetical protein KORDIASMS9_00718 [Kordia sp. SMS9]
MKDEVVISQGNRPLWQNVIAALLYATAITLAVLFFYEFEFSLERTKLMRNINTFELATFALMFAFYFSIIQAYYFDFKNNRYKHERSFLIFKQGTWKPLPALEYISVFKKNVDTYEVNLWYAGNKHFKIYRLVNGDEAMKVGKQLATTLQIDLLDARIAHNSKWIDL